MRLMPVGVFTLTHMDPEKKVLSKQTFCNGITKWGSGRWLDVLSGGPGIASVELRMGFMLGPPSGIALSRDDESVNHPGWAEAFIANSGGLERTDIGWVATGINSLTRVGYPDPTTDANSIFPMTVGGGASGGVQVGGIFLTGSSDASTILASSGDIFNTAKLTSAITPRSNDFIAFEYGLTMVLV